MPPAGLGNLFFWGWRIVTSWANRITKPNQARVGSAPTAVGEHAASRHGLGISVSTTHTYHRRIMPARVRRCWCPPGPLEWPGSSGPGCFDHSLQCLTVAFACLLGNSSLRLLAHCKVMALAALVLRPYFELRWQARSVGPVGYSFGPPPVLTRNRVVGQVCPYQQGFNHRMQSLRSSCTSSYGESATGPPADRPPGACVTSSTGRGARLAALEQFRPGWSRSRSSVGGRMAIESSNPLGWPWSRMPRDLDGNTT